MAPSQTTRGQALMRAASGQTPSVMRALGAITVAIDGPAGAGKSTVAKRVAQALGFVLVDTGAIYRSAALLAERLGIAWEDEAALGSMVGNLSINFLFQHGVNRVFLSGEDVTCAIRTRRMSQGAAVVSRHASVRTGLLHMQRLLAGQHSAVLEGRDIGTVVYPLAEVKIFLDASPQERARRRHAELVARGEQVDLGDVLAEMQTRDRLDMQREKAPLKAAADAIHLDCTRLSVDEVIARIVQAVNAKKVGTEKPDTHKPDTPQPSIRAVHQSISQWGLAAGHADNNASLPSVVDQFMTVVLPQRMAERAHLVKEIAALYKLEVTGEGAGSWHIDLRVPGGSIKACADQAPCVLSLSSRCLGNLMRGNTNPQMAFLSGQLKICGDVTMALKLYALFD